MAILDILKTSFLVLSLILWLITIAGLIRPWWALWWSDHQTRLKVIGYFGIPAIILSLVLILF